MRCLLIIGSSQTQWYSSDRRSRCSPRAATRATLRFAARSWRDTFDSFCHAALMSGGRPPSRPIPRYPADLTSELAVRRARRPTSARRRPADRHRSDRSDLPGGGDVCAERAYRTTFAIKLPAQDDAVRERVALGLPFRGRVLHRRRRAGPHPGAAHASTATSATSGADFVLAAQPTWRPPCRAIRSPAAHRAEAQLAVEALAGLHAPSLV